MGLIEEGIYQKWTQASLLYFGILIIGSLLVKENTEINLLHRFL